MDVFTIFDHRLNMVDPHRHGYHDRGEKVDGRLQYSYNARLATNLRLKVNQNQIFLFRTPPSNNSTRQNYNRTPPLHWNSYQQQKLHHQLHHQEPQQQKYPQYSQGYTDQRPVYSNDAEQRQSRHSRHHSNSRKTTSNSDSMAEVLTLSGQEDFRMLSDKFQVWKHANNY